MTTVLVAEQTLWPGRAVFGGGALVQLGQFPQPGLLKTLWMLVETLFYGREGEVVEIVGAEDKLPPK